MTVPIIWPSEDVYRWRVSQDSSGMAETYDDALRAAETASMGLPALPPRAF